MKKTVLGLLATLSMMSSHVMADEGRDTDIAAKMRSLTGFEVQSVTENSTGLYEVVTDKGIFYATKDAEFLFGGQIYEFKDGLPNVTAQRKADIAKVDIDRLRDSFITYKSPTEKHEILVFFDTSCGYCRKMHSQISQYNALGITVHYAMWPRQGVFIPGSNNVHTQGYLDLQSVVCAENSNFAMDMVMRGTSIGESTCDNEIEDNYELGHWLGVAGTPAVYDLEGQLVSRGYLAPNQLFGSLENRG